MAIGDAERRDIAATMRIISDEGVRNLTLGEILNSILTGGAPRPTTEMAILARLADLIDRPTCHNASGHQDMCAQKPRTRKRAIYLVTDFGGDWEDVWERPVIAFTDKARAEECAAKRETRQYDEYGPIWDYHGSYVKEITLVDFGDRQEEK